MADIPSADRRGWGRPCSGRIVTITPLNMQLPVRAEVAPLFEAFIAECVAKGFRFNRVRDDWGYMCRHIRNDPSLPWSNHAWGLAVDLDATQNPYMHRLHTTFPGWVADLANRYGLRWGGDYTGSYYDPMHFEIVGTPADVRATIARRPAQEDDMDVAELRREFTIPGGPIRLAVHELARKAVAEALTDPGSPERIAVRELAVRAVNSALGIAPGYDTVEAGRGSPAREGVADLLQPEALAAAIGLDLAANSLFIYALADAVVSKLPPPVPPV